RLERGTFCGGERKPAGNRPRQEKRRRFLRHAFAGEQRFPVRVNGAAIDEERVQQVGPKSNGTILRHSPDVARSLGKCAAPKESPRRRKPVPCPARGDLRMVSSGR